MRSIALSTALLVAVPVAAYADPPQTNQTDRDRDHDRDREHNGDRAFEHERYDRWNDSHWSHDYHGRWRTMLSTAWRTISCANPYSWRAVSAVSGFS